MTKRYIIDSKMESKFGWLLPDGKYYKCGVMEHIGLAESLMEKSVHFTSSENAEHIAESNGWIKITGGYAISEKKPTQKQLDKLWDYSVLHKKDYDLLCAPLRNN